MCIRDRCLVCGVRLNKAIKHYGKENFVRRTIMEFETEEEAYAFEALIVDKNLVKREDCYNLTEGGGNPPTHSNGGTKEGVVKSWETRSRKMSEETKEKLRGKRGPQKNPANYVRYKRQINDKKNGSNT